MNFHPRSWLKLVSLSLCLSLFIAGCSEQQPAKVEAIPAKSTAKATQTSNLLISMTVYKSETCGCCKDWITHMGNNGFVMNTVHPDNLSQVKNELGVSSELRSCHTAVTKDGYVFEGHVPAKFVEQFLQNPPAGSLGLSVPAMPVGSPGMEMGDKFMPYQVVLMMKNGQHQVFAKIDSYQQQF
jgi:hypothetical protein